MNGGGVEFFGEYMVQCRMKSLFFLAVKVVTLLSFFISLQLWTFSSDLYADQNTPQNIRQQQRQDKQKEKRLKRYQKRNARKSITTRQNICTLRINSKNEIDQMKNILSMGENKRQFAFYELTELPGVRSSDPKWFSKACQYMREKNIQCHVLLLSAHHRGTTYWGDQTPFELRSSILEQHACESDCGQILGSPQMALAEVYMMGCSTCSKHEQMSFEHINQTQVQWFQQFRDLNYSRREAWQLSQTYSSPSGSVDHEMSNEDRLRGIFTGCNRIYCYQGEAPGGWRVEKKWKKYLQSYPSFADHLDRMRLTTNRAIQFSEARDVDGDGVENYDDINQDGTIDTVFDADQDGVADGLELEMDTNPLDAKSVLPEFSASMLTPNRNLLNKLNIIGKNNRSFAITEIGANYGYEDTGDATKDSAIHDRAKLCTLRKDRQASTKKFLQDIYQLIETRQFEAFQFSNLWVDRMEDYPPSSYNNQEIDIFNQIQKHNIGGMFHQPEHLKKLMQYDDVFWFAYQVGWITAEQAPGYFDHLLHVLVKQTTDEDRSNAYQRIFRQKNYILGSQPIELDLSRDYIENNAKTLLWVFEQQQQFPDFFVFKQNKRVRRTIDQWILDHIDTRYVVDYFSKSYYQFLEHIKTTPLGSVLDSKGHIKLKWRQRAFDVFLQYSLNDFFELAPEHPGLHDNDQVIFVKYLEMGFDSDDQLVGYNFVIVPSSESIEFYELVWILTSLNSNAERKPIEYGFALSEQLSHVLRRAISEPGFASFWTHMFDRLNDRDNAPDQSDVKKMVDMLAKYGVVIDDSNYITWVSQFHLPMYREYLQEDDKEKKRSINQKIEISHDVFIKYAQSNGIEMESRGNKNAVPVKELVLDIKQSEKIKPKIFDDVLRDLCRIDFFDFSVFDLEDAQTANQVSAMKTYYKHQQESLRSAIKQNNVELASDLFDSIYGQRDFYITAFYNDLIYLFDATNPAPYEYAAFILQGEYYDRSRSLFGFLFEYHFNDVPLPTVDFNQFIFSELQKNPKWDIYFLMLSGENYGYPSRGSLEYEKHLIQHLLTIYNRRLLTNKENFAIQFMLLYVYVNYIEMAPTLYSEQTLQKILQHIEGQVIPAGLKRGLNDRVKKSMVGMIEKLLERICRMILLGELSLSDIETVVALEGMQKNLHLDDIQIELHPSTVKEHGDKTLIQYLINHKALVTSKIQKDEYGTYGGETSGDIAQILKQYKKWLTRSSK